jgi:hypothetical protein
MVIFHSFLYIYQRADRPVDQVKLGGRFTQVRRGSIQSVPIWIHDPKKSDHMMALTNQI